jgi:hypothetical protein
MTTLLCVGSGLARRYVINTLQALALPYGARLQFRYTDSIIAPELIRPLERNALAGAKVLLGYVDCNESGRTATGRCGIIPYREAALLDSRRGGSIFTLRFEMRALRRSLGFDEFQASLPDASPHWERNPDDTFKARGNSSPLSGWWCQEIGTEVLSQAPVPKEDTVATWQGLVSELSKRSDFGQQPYFYMVEGLFRRKEGRPTNERVALENGEYRLGSRVEYELSVIHFEPNFVPHAAGATNPEPVLILDLPGPVLTARSSPLMVIDSPYDISVVHLATSEVNRLTYTSLYLHPKSDEPELDIVPGLYFPATIEGNFVRLIGNGLILGALLTVTQLAAVFAKGTFPGSGYVATLIAVVGIGTGLFVSLGMRKPF